MSDRDKRKKNLKLEKQFERDLKNELEQTYPNCMVLKLDPNLNPQGIPDRIVLYGNKWATLECKRSAKSKHRPNQDYYVEKMNNMSFSRFIYPENKEEVLDELQKTFRP